MIIVFLGLAGIEGSVTRAWEVVAGLRSPADSTIRRAWAAWILSVLGYIAVPVVLGTVVAVLVDIRIETYRRPRSKAE